MKLDFTLLCTSYALVGKHFQSSWLRFLGDSQVLLTVNLIKPDYLLSILNQITIILNSLWKKSQRRLSFLNMIINKSGTKVLMDICDKPTDSKRYAPYKSSHPRHCLKNFSFSLARRIWCMIVESEHLKEKSFKKLKKNTLSH